MSSELFAAHTPMQPARRATVHDSERTVNKDVVIAHSTTAPA